MSTVAVVNVAIAVFCGAALQRVSGIGFALLASPFLMFVLGAREGVALANFLALAVSVTTLVTTWRDVEVRQALLLTPAGLLGVPFGVFAVYHVAPGPLQVLAGGLVIVGLVFAVVGFTVDRRPGSAFGIGFGLGSGFMTAVAGVGGPALTAYARVTNWDQKAFAATAQVSFASQAIFALVLKGLPRLDVRVLSGTVAMVALGLVCGQLLAGRLNIVIARRAALCVASVAAIAAIVKGVLESVGSGAN